MSANGDVNEPATMQRVAEGLVPYVTHFILNDWDWRPWMAEPPTIRPGVDEPKVLPPGYVSISAWSITFEGAYPWAISFDAMAFEEGPVKEYLGSHQIVLECEAGYAISIHLDN